MRKFLKVVSAVIASTAFVIALSGCSMIESTINDIKGDLVGNSFYAEFYDNYGELTMTTQGDKINLSGNRVKEHTYTSDGIGTSYSLSSVVTITIDGHEIETCGDTVVFAEKGLEKDVSGQEIAEIASRNDGSLLDNNFFAYNINEWENMIGKSRAVVIKSQMGRPLCVYSGDKVYYEVCEDLPKTTKLMIDGHALYIHRANFQIIDMALL